MIELSGRHVRSGTGRATPAATTARCDRSTAAPRPVKSSGSRGGRSGGARPGARPRRRPSAPSRPGRSSTLAHHVAAEHRAAHPGRAEALDRQRDQQVLARRRPSRRGTSRARPPTAARRGSRACRRATRHGTTRYGAPRSTSPRRVRRATCSSVKPSARRSATQAASIASSSGPRRPGRSTTTNRHGVVWCGAGAVTAAATARRTAAGSTGSSVKARTVRRAGTTSRGAQPEHVLVRPGAPAPPHPARPRAVTAAGEPADHRDRPAGRACP